MTARLVRVQQGKRLLVTWVNTTTMYHPMHIHGHADTDNPGQWTTHCHNVYREQSGMMGIIGYIT